MKNSHNRTNREQITHLSDLEKTISYKFNDISLLNQALTHKSFAHENTIKDNERLEFLGDAVLQFIISDYLMKHYPVFSEGMLSKFRAVLVSETRLKLIARKINLGIYLNIGRGEEITGGRDKSSILADTLEALLAAIYLDSKGKAGSRIIAEVIIQLFSTEILDAETTFTNLDHKTELQEYVQKNRLGKIEYQIIAESGPDHQKKFITAILIDGLVVGTGEGKSKKISEQNAAVDSLEKIK